MMLARAKVAAPAAVAPAVAATVVVGRRCHHNDYSSSSEASVVFVCRVPLLEQRLWMAVPIVNAQFQHPSPSTASMPMGPNQGSSGSYRLVRRLQ